MIPSVSSRYGGPVAALKAMASGLAAEGVSVVVATTDADSGAARLDVPVGTPVTSDAVYYHFKRTAQLYNVSLGLLGWLRKHVAEFDVVHIHALFTWSSTVAAFEAKRQRVPYVVRPLGVLNQWGMTQRRPLAKRLSFGAVESRILRGSACIHYTSDAERNEAALLGAAVRDHRSVVIPVPVQTLAAGDAALLQEKFPILRGGKVILFLSRLHPKKGIELLLDAFALVRKRHPDAVLLIAGDGDAACVESLRARRSAVEQGAQIVWAGHIDGALKASAFATASMFVLPSASENFGVAAAESLGAGIPTIVSPDVAISAEIAAARAGIVVERETKKIAQAINDVLASAVDLQTLVANGRQLVNERYSTTAVGRALVQLYRGVVSPVANRQSER